MSNTTAVARTTCAKCSRDVWVDAAIHLWDGKDYCCNCISAASPLLLEYARENSVLSETLVVNPREALSEEFWRMTILGGAVVVLFVVLSFLDGRFSPWMGAFVTILVTSLAASLRLAGAYLNAKWIRGTLELCEGQFTVHRSFGVPFEWPLHSCQWRTGRIRDGRHFFAKVHLKREVILLSCPMPQLRFIRLKPILVPCGLSDEWKELWQAFLTLAEIPQL